MDIRGHESRGPLEYAHHTSSITRCVFKNMNKTMHFLNYEYDNTLFQGFIIYLEREVNIHIGS